MADYRENSPYNDSGDDVFINDLIDAVQNNPCVYNRYDPLHKMSEYKHEVWKIIAQDLNFDGQPVELERKWRHMRDKYVRLRKQDKLCIPIKKNSKWYAYYRKMSFLDPYVEHRNRKKKDDELDEKNDFNGEPQTDNLIENEEMRFSTTDALNKLYESFMVENQDEVKPQSVEILEEGEHFQSSPSTSVSPITITTQNVNYRKRRFESEVCKIDNKNDREDEDSEISLFVRSVSKSLSSMDKRTFAVARIEIAKVLYNCQYGDLKVSL